MMTSKTLGFGLFVVGLLAGVTAPLAGAESPELQESEPAPAALTVEEWMAQGQADAAAVITDAYISDTAEGLRIELVSDRPLAIGTSRTEGNALITDIPNAVLELVNEGTAEQFAPAEGIALVQLTSLPDGTVRLAITGTDGPPTAQTNTAAGNLVFNVAPGLAQLDGAEEAIQIGVTGQGQSGYRVPNTSVGSRTDTPLRDLPFSVQVVPQELLQDRQVQSVNEALRTVVGISPDNSSQSAFEGYTIRGFSGRNILRNGLRDDTNITSRIAIPNIERVEVLRGPAGALFSQGSPGGTVNIVTKKPLATPQYNVTGTIGNFDTYGGSLDFTGPLNASETLLYRLTAGASSAGTFIDFFDRQNYVIAPVLSWQINPNTQLTIEGEYNISEQPNDRGLPAVGTILPNINGQLPCNRFIGEPNDDLDKNDRYLLRLGYTLDHQINPDWQLQNSFRASFQQTPQNSLFASDLLPDQRTLERGIFSTSDQSQDNYSFDTSLTGTVQTGSISHQLLLGFDVNRDIYAASNQEFSLDPIDIFNPVYGVAQSQFIADYPREPFITNSVGVYVQDQIDLLPQLKLLLGGRFDLVSQQSLFTDGSQDFQQDQAFSPRLGIVYQPSDNHALYASYSRSFLQSVGTAFDNTLFEPERGNQYEVGIKSDWLENRLSTTLAFYQITRTNVLTEDPLNPNFSGKRPRNLTEV
jgi:iron complex outermembrane receptor protein